MPSAQGVLNPCADRFAAKRGFRSSAVSNHFRDRFDLDRHSGGQRMGAGGNSRMGSGGPENGTDQVGSGVEDFCLIPEIGGTAHKTGQPDHAHDTG